MRSGAEILPRGYWWYTEVHRVYFTGIFTFLLRRWCYEVLYYYWSCLFLKISVCGKKLSNFFPYGIFDPGFPNSSWILSTSLLNKFVFFLLFPKKKYKIKNQNEQKNNEKGMPKLNKNLTQTKKQIIKTNQILCWPSTPRYGTCPGVWLICPVTPLWRKLIFPFPATINCKSLLG